MNYMITHVSTQKMHHPKIVNLQMPFNHIQDPINHALRKVKKMTNYRSTERCIKLLNVIECLNLHDIQPQPSYRDIQGIVKQNRGRNSSANSYLAYKQEQKRQKERSCNKVNYMKNKYRNHRKWLQTKQKSSHTQRPISKTFDFSRSIKRTSFVNLSDNFSSINDSPCSSHRQRIYIKTNQGKRQKIDAGAYISRIKNKISDFQHFQHNLNPLSQKYSFMHNNVLRQVKHFDYSIFNARKRIMNRQKSKRQIANVADQFNLGKIEECRPWTSNKTNKSQTINL